ncbi:MAG: PqqD family protein [Lachnospiraceae bacterium]|nr:PqqD family protein [Lachnospiraceae bacterium]
MKKKTGNYLDYIPVRNDKYTWKQTEDGSVTILVENKGIFHWMAQRFLHKPRVSQIHLEEFGSFLWERMDGKHTVYDIGQQMSLQFGEKAEPLYPRLVQYMKNLEQYEFVVMKQPEKRRES